MRLEHTIDIDAPIDRVWDLTLDIEALPSLTPTMTSVERLDEGPLVVGSRARIKQPAQSAKVWTVTQLEPRKHFAWATRAMGTRMTGSHHLEESATGTTNTVTIDIEGALAPLVGLILRIPIKNAIKQENQGFKDAAERELSHTI